MLARLAFEELNLRRNPFGEAPREERATLAEVDLPLPLPGEALQVLGEAGHGKSTHLLALAARLEGATYEYVPEGARAFRAPLDARGPLCLDEAQRVKPRLLRALFRTGRTLVLGTHADLSPHAGRPLRTVRLEGPVPLERLRRIVARRLEWARRGPGPVPLPADDTLRALIARHAGDVRAIEGELYERYQTFGGNAHGQL